MEKRKVVELQPDISDKLKQIGYKISLHRKSVNRNYKKFALENHINNMTLWRIEQGEDFKMSSFLEILQALGISPNEFFNEGSSR